MSSIALAHSLSPALMSHPVSSANWDKHITQRMVACGLTRSFDKPAVSISMAIRVLCTSRAAVPARARLRPIVCCTKLLLTSVCVQAAAKLPHRQMFVVSLGAAIGHPQQNPQASERLRVVGRGPWLAASLSWLQCGCCVKGAGERRCHPLLAQGASPAIRCLRGSLERQVLSATTALRDSAACLP